MSRRNQANVDVVRTFMTKVFNQKDLALLDSTVGETYVQHNPMGADGKDGLRKMLQYTAPNVEIVRAMSEGDLVVLHNRSTGWGDGKTYVSFDVFRVVDGRIVEHWDVMQAVEEKTASGHTQTDGPTALGATEHAVDSRAVVQGFLDDCVYGHHWENLGRHISADSYVQHNPGIADGLSGFGAAMKKMAEQRVTMAFEKTHRMVADGDFVFVHSSGEYGGKKVAFADLMRVDGGRIVEHWDAIQPVGAPNPSGHDMFTQVTK
jgi:predicted SnoaL-like aldol condensation-catalyzing enzyme